MPKDSKTITKRFKIAKESLKSHINRPIIISKILFTNEGYIKFLTDEIEKVIPLLIKKIKSLLTELKEQKFEKEILAWSV